MTESIIEIKNLNVIFKQRKRDFFAVKDANLEIKKGDIFGIVGYSGAGKSTLVRTINLLQVPSNGFIKVEDRVLFNEKQIVKGNDLREIRRRIGMIFQHFNLMLESTVIQNVDFALKHTVKNEKSRKERSLELLKLVGLNDKADVYPSQLSGGQKQRVAIARALANDPEILISDEATSALDPKTTRQILDLLKELNRKLGITIVLITHEMQVVKEIAKHVAVVENGEIIESGETVDIFANPKKPLTKEFIGMATGLNDAIQTIKSSPTIKKIASEGQLVKLTYKGKTADEPVINNVYEKFKVTSNILFGNVEILNGISIGSLIVILKGSTSNIKKAHSEFENNGIEIEVLQEGKK